MSPKWLFGSDLIWRLRKQICPKNNGVFHLAIQIRISVAWYAPAKIARGYHPSITLPRLPQHRQEPGGLDTCTGDPGVCVGNIGRVEGTSNIPMELTTQRTTIHIGSVFLTMYQRRTTIPIWNSNRSGETYRNCSSRNLFWHKKQRYVYSAAP